VVMSAAEVALPCVRSRRPLAETPEDEYNGLVQSTLPSVVRYAMVVSSSDGDSPEMAATPLSTARVMIGVSVAACQTTRPVATLRAVRAPSGSLADWQSPLAA